MFKVCLSAEQLRATQHEKNKGEKFKRELIFPLLCSVNDLKTIN